MICLVTHSSRSRPCKPRLGHRTCQAPHPMCARLGGDIKPSITRPNQMGCRGPPVSRSAAAQDPPPPPLLRPGPQRRRLIWPAAMRGRPESSGDERLTWKPSGPPVCGCPVVLSQRRSCEPRVTAHPSSDVIGGHVSRRHLTPGRDAGRYCRWPCHVSLPAKSDPPLPPLLYPACDRSCQTV